VLNTFAYTGSLGVAARAAPAREVTHTDRSRAFLDLAKRSYALNGFDARRGDFLAGDFFDVSARLRRDGALYDCVFLDPPFFSETTGGKVDLARDAQRVIAKVRPLVGDGGRLVIVNNALFLTGREWMDALAGLCADGYLTIESHLPVGEDFTGTPATRRSAPPLDPAPFTHTTRITVLRARRKDGRRATE
jgi:23S rRNA (cytosine1962-C5)-methyltransferase